MKIILSLALMSLIACGGQSSHKNNKRTAPETDDIDGTMVVSSDGKVQEGAEKKSPAVGVYLGVCEAEGSLGVASGVEITATEIRPVTAIFGDQTCAVTTLQTFGFTGSFVSFLEYSTFLNKISRDKGDGVAASYLDTSITFAWESGHKISFIKTDVAFLSEKRLKVFADKVAIDKAAGTVKGKALITNSVFAPTQTQLGFYCKKDNVLVSRELSADTATGLFTAKLNTWGVLVLPTECQVTVAFRKSTGEVIDLAYSQVISVK